MTGDVLKEIETASLRMAALRGWIVGVLFGTAVVACFGFWNVVQSAPAPGEILISLPLLLFASVPIALIGAIIALPAPILGFVLIWLAERVSHRSRNLPFWLAAGLAVSLPSANWLWLPAGDFFSSDSPRLSADLYSWNSLQLPLLVLACGLVGAFFAWRSRQAELAE